MKKLPLLILFVLSWLYLWLRAVYLPLVHDESATFFIYIQSGKFLPFQSYADANNHLLNSALSYLSFSLFGSSPLPLRLPNLMLWPVFFFSVYAISKRIHDNVLRRMTFLSLILAHNFIEFFGLCRGYGMSMGFLALAVFFLIRSVEKQRMPDKIGSILAMMLALSANLTLINTALLVISILCVNELLRKESKGKMLANLTVIIALCALPVFYLLKWLLFLKKSGLLYYHSTEGFLNATPGTLAFMLTGSENILIPWVMLFLCFLVAGLVIYLLFKTRVLLNYQVIFSALLLGNIIAIVLGKWIMGINYPEDRTAMYLFPFLIFSLGFLLDKQKVKFFQLLRYPVFAMMLFFPLHFLYSLNVSHSSLWYQEGIPQRFYERIENDKKETKTIPSIGGYMLRRFCWGYLNYSHGGELPMVKTSGYPDMTADYQIVHMNKDIPWLFYYNQLDHDLPSGLSLLERKKHLERKEVYSVLLPTATKTEAEYFSLFEHNIDSLKAKSFFIEVSFELESGEVPFQSAIVGSVNDSKGQNVAYETIELNWFHYQWNDKTPSFHQGLLISNLPPDAKQLSVYIVNSLKKSFVIKDCKLVVYKI